MRTEQELRDHLDAARQNIRDLLSQWVGEDGGPFGPVDDVVIERVVRDLGGFEKLPKKAARMIARPIAVARALAWALGEDEETLVGYEPGTAPAEDPLEIFNARTITLIYAMEDGRRMRVTATGGEHWANNMAFLRALTKTAIVEDDGAMPRRRRSRTRR